MTIIGEAVLDVLPGTDKFGDVLKQQILPAAEEAGKAGGEELGKSMGDVLPSALTGASAAVAAFSSWASSEFKQGSFAIRRETGLTGDALDDLVGSMQEVGKSGVTTAMGEIGETIGALRQRVKSLSGEALEELTRQIVVLAELTGEDASDSVEQIVDLFKVWEVATRDQSSTLDLLWRASQRSGSSVSDIIATLKTGAGTFKLFGMNLEESLAFIVKTEKQGGDAAKTLQALNMAFARLSQGTEEPSAAFAEIADRIGNAETRADALRIAVEAFGARAGPTLAAAIRAGRFEVDALAESLGSGTETISQARDETTSWTDRLEQLRNTVAANIAPVAQWVAVVATIATGIQPATAGLNKLREGLGLAEVGLGSMAGAAGAATLVVGAIALTMQAAAEEAAQHEANIKNLSDALRSGQSTVADYSAQMTELNTIRQQGGIAGDLARDLELDYQAALINTRAELINELSALQKGRGALSDRQSALIQAKIDEDNLAGASRLLAAAQDKAAASAQEHGEAQLFQAEATREARQAMLELLGGFTGVIASARNLKEQQRELTEIEQKLNRLRRQGKEDTRGYRDTLKEQRDASLELFDAGVSLRQQIFDYMGQLREAGRTNDQISAKVRKLGEEFGLTKQQVQGLINEGFDQLPKQKITRFETPGLDAEISKVITLSRLLSALPAQAAHAIGALENVPATAPGGGGSGGSSGAGGKGPVQRPNPTRTSFSIHLNGKQLTQVTETTRAENEIYLGGLSRYDR